MPNEKPTKGKQKQGEQQTHARPSQSITPSTNRTDIEAPEATDRATRPQNQKQVSEPRPFVLWMQSWLTIIFTGMIFIVTAIYAYFSYGQWSSMDKSLDETKRNRELEYRAYVSVKSVQIVSEVDNPAVGNLIITAVNTGRTPGLNGKILTEIKFQENPPPESTVLNPPDKVPSRTVFAPQIEVIRPAGALPTKEPAGLRGDQKAEKAASKRGRQKTQTTAPVPTSALAPVSQEVRKIYVYGLITYDDIFGQRRWTKFCFFNTLGTAMWWHCQTFNDAN